MRPLQIPVPTTGETVVLFRRLKRRQEIAELLEAYYIVVTSSAF